MEVCAPGGESVAGETKCCLSLDLSENHSLGLSEDCEQNSNSRDVLCLINSVENAIAESLHINDNQESGGELDGDVSEIAEAKNLYKGSKVSPVKSSEKIVGKCASFPCTGIVLRCSSTDDEEEVQPEIAVHGHLNKDGENSIGRSKSWPASPKLVSALKGSREKQGLSPKKLSVSWAPDVYDPTPTSLSHTVPKGKSKQRNQHKRNDNKKKNSKNKHKGKGGSSKDKKQVRRSGGGGCASRESFLGASDCHDDFDIGSPDYCGKTFLIQSLTKVHYSTAEAL